jgi:hypothetical protein
MPRGKGKIKRWTIEEDRLLGQHASSMTMNELIALIDATYMQIRYRCQQLNLRPKPIYKTWTIQELQIAQSNPRRVAAEILKRNLSSIDSRIQYAKKQSTNN